LIERFDRRDIEEYLREMARLKKKGSVEEYVANLQNYLSW